MRQATASEMRSGGGESDRTSQPPLARVHRLRVSKLILLVVFLRTCQEPCSRSPLKNNLLAGMSFGEWWLMHIFSADIVQ